MADRLILTRRGMIAGGVTVLGAGTLALTSCAPGNGGDSGGSSDLASGDELAKLSDVEVGGTLAVTVKGTDILLAQPTEGDVVAFSAVCTHEGCAVKAQPDIFECPCHGSRYEPATGEVLRGPAEDPLSPIEVTVSGDAIVVA